MRTMILIIVSGLLTACGGTGRRAADACMVEINSRLAGKNIDVDVGQLGSSAKESGADTLLLTGPIVFDRGTSSEYTQAIECRVRRDGGTSTVIFLQFNWSMDDVRTSQ